MNAERLGRLARTLRVRHRLTQVALANRAGVSRRAVSTLERGQLGSLRLEHVETLLTALGARLDLRVFWNGPELDRMLDEAHAALGGAVKRRLERWGWLVRVEVSFSRYGERGRVDLLAFHPGTGTLVVIELKTDLVDVQALLGSLDVKTRLARGIAERFGWQVRTVVPAIVWLEHSATRKRLARVSTLFDAYSLRGRSAITWLRQPSTPPPGGLMWFAARPGVRRSGPRERVRSSAVKAPSAGRRHSAKVPVRASVRPVWDNARPTNH